MIFRLLIIFLTFSICTNLIAQDKIVYFNEKGKIKTINGKILKVDSNYISVQIGNKQKQLSLNSILGYTIANKTIDIEQGYTIPTIFHNINDKVFINYKFSNINKSENFNDFYNRCIQNYTEFNFQNGYILLTEKDTIKCQICLNNKKTDTNSYLFAIAKIENKIQIFTANDIYGYSVNNCIYLSYRTINNNNISSFFIKQTIQGKIYLYERDEIPQDNHFIFLFCYATGGNFYVVRPYENDMKIDVRNTGNDSKNQRINFTSNNSEEKFKTYMSKLFSDCELITNKIKSGFYSSQDMTQIIREYNNCFNVK